MCLIDIDVEKLEGSDIIEMYKNFGDEKGRGNVGLDLDKVSVEVFKLGEKVEVLKEKMYVIGVFFLVVKKILDEKGIFEK